MRVNDLKVGDRVKFYWKNGDYKSYTGKIEQLKLNWFYITALDSSLCDWVYKDNIVSKLEKQYDYCPFGDSYWYKDVEIPIEKEKSEYSGYYEFHCPQCGNGHGLLKTQGVVTSNYCPMCIKSWNKKETNVYMSPLICKKCGDVLLPDENNYSLCCKCNKKEKSAPKSSKFDFRVQSSECKYDDSRKRMSAKMTGFGIFGKDRIELDLVLPYDYKLGDLTLGKVYEVEIKEKL